MRISLFRATVVAVAFAAVGSVLVSAQGQRRSRPGTVDPQATQQNGAYSRADAEIIGKRLYLAILGREADTAGLNVTVDELMRANLPAQAQSLFDSTEFRNTQGRKSSAELLAQFYRGLLDRNPDQAGIDAFMPRMDRKTYTNVIAEMVRSPEFQGKLSAVTGRPSTSAPQGSFTRIDVALACQGRVIQAIRNDAGGRVFVTFDRMPDVSADGQAVSGPGMDRFVNNNDRPLTYRCEGNNVTYNYSDRRRPVAADNKLGYPSVAVRNCENAVRDGLVFDAAALSASDTNTEYVLGLVGGTVRQCTMDRQRVVSVK